MKILLVMESVPGAQKHERKEDLYSMAARSYAAVANHTDLYVMSPLDPHLADSVASDYRVDTCIYPNRNWLSLLFGSGKAHALLRRGRRAVERHYRDRGKPDLVVGLQSIDSTGMLARTLKESLGIPYIVWEHKTSCQRGRLSPDKRREYAAVIEASERVYAVSQPLRDTLVHNLEVTDEKVSVLHNAVSDSFFEPPRQQHLDESCYKRTRNTFVFGGWTNWRSIKNPHLAVDAFFGLMERLPDTTLVLAGLVTEDVKRRVEGIDRVYLTGPLDRHGVHELAHTVDCCILPSDHETFGLPLIEAFAAGRPAVTTRCGGPESFFPSSDFGEIVDKGDAEAFSAAMERVYHACRQGRYQSQTIAAHCRRHFSESHHVENIQKNLTGIAHHLSGLSEGR